MYYKQDPCIIQHGNYKIYNGINNIFNVKKEEKKLKQVEINLTQPTPIMYITV